MLLTLGVTSAEDNAELLNDAELAAAGVTQPVERRKLLALAAQAREAAAAEKAAAEEAKQRAEAAAKAAEENSAAEKRAAAEKVEAERKAAVKAQVEKIAADAAARVLTEAAAKAAAEKEAAEKSAAAEAAKKQADAAAAATKAAAENAAAEKRAVEAARASHDLAEAAANKAAAENKERAGAERARAAEAQPQSNHGSGQSPGPLTQVRCGPLWPAMFYSAARPHHCLYDNNACPPSVLNKLRSGTSGAGALNLGRCVAQGHCRVSGRRNTS